MEGIAQQLPDLGGADLAEERDRWKDVLHWMVHKESDNTALSRICSGKDLNVRAEKNGCRAKFISGGTHDSGMASFLSSEERRILRKDHRRPGAQSQFMIFAGPRPAATSARGDKEEKDQAVDFYSLGHDAIAVELDTWGAARTVLLRRRDYFKVLMQRMTQVFAIYVAGASIFLIFTNYDSTANFYVQALEKLSGALISLMFAAGLWFFSERIAREVVERLMRSRVFQNLLWEQPVQ